MAPKKKAPTNGYFYLLMELRNTMDMKSANEQAGRMWPKMSAAEKEPYNMRAQKAKANKTVAKMTAVHENVEFVQKQEQDERNREHDMKEDIKSHIKFITDSNTIAQEYFHIMHVNNYFRTTHNVYYPAEIALVRFNFQNGVLDRNVFESRIRPGKFPTGYMGQAKIASDSTHKIPYMDTEKCNMEEITRDIFEFLEESAKMCSNPNKLPAIYVKEDFLPMVQDVLYQMADSYGYDPSELRVYSLSFLLFTIRNDVSNTSPWPSITNSSNELDRDIYDFTPDIACKFHTEETDDPVHCSRSHVVRMAYILCDNCCKDMGIQLVAGRHVPKDADTDRMYADSNYAKSEASYRTAPSCAPSVSHSYRSNVNTLEFDKYTTGNNSDLDWVEVRSDRSGRSFSSSKTMSAADSFATNGSSQTSRGPRTDWRETNFGKGRGRGLATKK